MRRSTAMGVGAVVVAASIAAGTTAAIGASSTPSAQSQARRIAAYLATDSGRAHYGLTTGQLVAADVCVRGSCVHRDYAAAPACRAGATCIGTAMVVRRFPHGVTVSAELD